MATDKISEYAKILKEKVHECETLGFTEDEQYAHGVVALLEELKKEFEKEEAQEQEQEAQKKIEDEGERKNALITASL